MKSLIKTIACIGVIVALISCKKKEGCTDCNATNYDSEADKDNNSCLYLHKNKLGVYAVSDSLVDPFQTTFFNNYSLVLTYNTCEPNEILISNYGNIKNSLNKPIEVVCTLVGDSIFVKSQLILGPDNSATSDYIQISANSGYFSNDSLFIPLSYSDRFDPYYGNCWGKKQ